MSTLMMQLVLILQCPRTIQLNTVTIIQILQEVYGSLKEMNHLHIMMEILAMLLQIIHNKSRQIKFVERKMITEGQTRVFKGVNIVVPLKYLSNIWRSLEIPLSNCKIHLELSWTKDCELANTNANTRFKITNTK